MTGNQYYSDDDDDISTVDNIFEQQDKRSSSISTFKNMEGHILNNYLCESPDICKLSL